MKSYKFRLASVARVRRLQEEIAKNNLMIALRDLNRAILVERQCIDEIRSFEMPIGKLFGAELQWGFCQQQRLHDRLNSAHVQVLKAQSDSASLRGQWLAANKQYEVLERLDAKKRLVFNEELVRLEAGELDDLSNARFIKKVLQ